VGVSVAGTWMVVRYRWRYDDGVEPTFLLKR
jgi:hypothetical protein